MVYNAVRERKTRFELIEYLEGGYIVFRSFTTAGKPWTAPTIRKLFKTASDYTDYKLKDHTENRQQEPEKKKLNDKDREKLNLMKNLTENKLLTKEKEAPAAKEPQIGAIK